MVSSVWRQPGEEYKDKCVLPTVKRGGSVMVWGCMRAAGTGELQFIEETMNANMYCEILKQSMIASLRRLGCRAVFQHDNNPKHTSKTTTALQKKLRVKVMDWPSMSPDLNPIKHLWGILKRKVEERKVSDIHQLRDVVMEEWKRMPVAACEALVNSMPKRVKAVLENNGPYTFVQQHLMIGTDPRAILKDLLPETIPPPELDDMTLWQIVINILSEPPKRKKRKDINSMEDAVKLLQECKKIIVLTGAGVSVSCGIPDFRSRDGIYARLAVDFPDLPDPQAMFDIEYFRKDPRPFFKFAKEIYPGQFQPSLCHKFIALMDKERKLLRNYTQNIDTLEQVAGIQRIIQCHGSFATASCLICKYKVDCEVVRGDIFNQVVPRCPRCPPDELLAIMKPEIVFFGENLPEQFHRAMKYDKDEVDLLIVIGSSLKVRPVALIPSSIPHEVPQILINREPLPHLHFDVELLGDCDVIINELCHRLGGEYTKLCNSSVKLSEITEKPPRPHKEFEIHSAELPPTPLNISEYSSSPDRITPQDSWVVRSEHSSEYKARNSDAFESKENCVEEKSQEVQNSLENIESLPGQLENPEHVKEHGSNEGENKERSEKPVETLRKFWVNKCAKEQISKRLDGTQYLFLPPNRYIFHGAEVYSDSEDDVISSSSCGSSSDSGTCHSPSLDIEDESEIEEFYNGVEEDDAPDREEENGFGEDGIDLQDSVDESVSVNEAVGFDCSADRL
ncbi:NAD-dependent protein deacetylase sirtuin-1 [Varanus komodoensis]|nr:NAD-dependent protein deacetylase sirtuin-1 [Varanus komodoensis]